jgi:hypothetical protein
MSPVARPISLRQIGGRQRMSAIVAVGVSSVPRNLRNRLRRAIPLDVDDLRVPKRSTPYFRWGVWREVPAAMAAFNQPLPFKPFLAGAGLVFFVPFWLNTSGASLAGAGSLNRDVIARELGLDVGMFTTGLLDAA